MSKKGNHTEEVDAFLDGLFIRSKQEYRLFERLLRV
jgi:hypothetical protein